MVDTNKLYLIYLLFLLFFLTVNIHLYSSSDFYFFFNLLQKPNEML